MKIITSTVTTPIGDMTAGSTGKGICLLEWSKERIDQHFKNGEILKPGMDDHISLLKDELSDYFDLKVKSFSVPLDLIGTDFQKTVWNALCQIPYGRTSTYMQQAKSIGNPKAIRAMAIANGKNKISIIIPCHRVIGSDGSLTGYGGGLENKRLLLELESKQLHLF